jgi:hypothetical protein
MHLPLEGFFILPCDSGLFHPKGQRLLARGGVVLSGRMESTMKHTRRSIFGMVAAVPFAALLPWRKKEPAALTVEEVFRSLESDDGVIVDKVFVSDGLLVFMENSIYKIEGPGLRRIDRLPTHDTKDMHEWRSFSA